MIRFISGVPGSGKTYFAVTELIKDRHKDTRIYTNIVLDQEKIKTFTFDFNNFKENILTHMYELKDDREACIAYAKEHNYYDVSIYYDECHLGLAAQDEKIIWWLSWHRHLNQDIILITQNKTTIAAKYRAYPEIFTHAIPATKRFFSSRMKYHEYGDYRMNKDSLIRSFTLKADSKIFEIYQTGEANKGSNSMRKKIYLLGPLFLLPFIAFYYLTNMFNPSDQEEEKVINTDSKIIESRIIKSNIYIESLKVERSYDDVKYLGYFWKYDSKQVQTLLKMRHITTRYCESVEDYAFSSEALNFLKLMLLERGYKYVRTKINIDSAEEEVEKVLNVKKSYVHSKI